jgi:hypothetical protein
VNETSGREGHSSIEELMAEFYTEPATRWSADGLPRRLRPCEDERLGWGAKLGFAEWMMFRFPSVSRRMAGWQ